MLKILSKAVFLFFAIQTLAFSQEVAKKENGQTVFLFEDGTWHYADSITVNNKDTRVLNLEIPKTTDKDKIIAHTGYSLSYNEIHEQANWVAYELTKEETVKQYERTNKFLLDPKVNTVTASDRDYKGSGFDRGHLAPASDMGWSSVAMKESFYYSNMSPQLPSFNRGIWKKLEELVRTWAVENNSLYVVTGPILEKGLTTIGINKVSVPKYYYKVILDNSEPSIKGIGFILPNQGSKNQLKNYAVSIDYVEKATGIDFFPLLKDKQEDSIESKICIECWSWKTNKSTTQNNSYKTSVTAQCSGITKKGKRCKRMTKNENGRCYQH